VDQLLVPLNGLFELIYNERKVADQWLVSKTILILKNKGQTKDIEKYRPIANLCFISKIFENLILKRIMEIHDENGTDITGHQQHGFKKIAVLQYSQASFCLKYPGHWSLKTM
jgi:hypothetical protein